MSLVGLSALAQPRGRPRVVSPTRCISCHLPPVTNALGQHAVLPPPAIQLCRDAVPTLPSDTDEHFPLPQPPAEGHSGPRIGGLSIRPIGCIGFIDARTFRRCGKLCEINFATCTRDLAGRAG